MRTNNLVMALVVMLIWPATQARATEAQETGSDSFSSGLPTRLHESIGRSRYEIVEDAAVPGSFLANNPAQGLRARFNAGGVRVLVDESEAELGMQLSGHGRVGNLTRVAGADIVVDHDRIEYRRDGITEWYVNSHIGIEQGFTIHQRPTGNGELVVDLGVSGGLEPERVGSDLVFQGVGASVEYAKLHAFDATGRPLSSRMELISSGHAAQAMGRLRLRLSVDDRGAHYPVVVDPIIGTEKKIVPFDPEFGALFGVSVSISGDTAISGSRDDDPAGAGFLNSGSAYIYQRNVGGTDNWGLVKKLTASDAATGDQFGTSVSISGDTVLVGSDVNDGYTGAVYVYERDLGGTDNWGEVEKLTASDGAPVDNFGSSVSIDGDTALIGAWRDGDAGTDSGSAYIFQRNAGGVNNWGEVTKITASDADEEDQFGFSVSISADTAIIGAYTEGVMMLVSGTGSAYVYERNAGGADNWGEVKKINASDAAPGDAFGWSVAISGDHAVVGALTNADAGFETGSAYVFQRDAGGVDNWGEVKKLLASDAAPNEVFGNAVAIGGDTVLVGGIGDDDDGPFSGSAYLYRENSGGIGNWGEVTKITASDATEMDDFGFFVAVSSNGIDLMVGAYNDFDDPVFAAGSAYVYMYTDVSLVPTLSANGKIILVLLMTALVLAGMYRARRVETSS